LVLQHHVFRVQQQRGDFLIFPSDWAHQVVTEGPPTLKVAWAMLPYMSLEPALECAAEYRQQQRILIGNAGKAIVLGAQKSISKYQLSFDASNTFKHISPLN
jgi:hypothetical protein